uniref:Uncharacterized protein n=1 Tax=Onchocerca volvulus TaxID=6282 RepID=A0A8R1XR56_ONCVO
MAAESVTNLIPLNARTNEQLKKDFDGWKSSGKHYRKASYGAHASFRLRMLQEQRIQPSFITKIPSIRRQKLDELQHGDLNKSKFALYAVQNGHELFADFYKIYYNDMM